MKEAQKVRTITFLTRSISRQLMPFHRLLVILIGAFLAASVWAGSSPSGTIIDAKGHVDAISFDGQRVNVLGWAATNQPNMTLTTVSISFNGKPVYEGGFENFPRPDVAGSTGRADWLNSGWKVSFELPDEVKAGHYIVSADAKTASGHTIRLATSDASQTVSIEATHREEKSLIRTVKISIACALIFLVTCFMKSAHVTDLIRSRFGIRVSEPSFFSLAVLLVSLLFVSMGLTGSSLQLGQASAPFIQVDSINVMASNQAIRSDEWLVITPLAIAQYNHEPRFPVVNKNIGEDGQNMLVVGMTGAPVAHVSAVAKPATWGFFLFDLKRALSWNWCFPIVGCFLALAYVLNRLSDAHWKQGFLFSGLFCCAPYIVGWSNWPAYTVFFPCIIFLSALRILHTSSAFALFVFGLLLGIAGAGFVFVLYPAWQITVGYVFVALTIGILIKEKSYRAFTTRRVITFIGALSIAGVIIGAWWMDASHAIHTMAETVYPGQRLATGGGMTLPVLLRGFTNIATLTHLSSTFSNQSEIASFYYLLLPLGVLLMLRAIYQPLNALEWSITLITGFILFYMFVGLPAGLSKILLWSHVPAPRADLALGLATLVLTQQLFSGRWQDGRNAPTATVSVLAAGTAVAWVYIVYRNIRQLDSSLLTGLTPGIMTAMLFTVAAISYFLITRNLKSFIVTSLGLSLATTVMFNPVNIAPRSIKIAGGPETNVKLDDALKHKKILMIDNPVGPMFLAAAGMPIVNGVFYYPQKSLWSRLDPSSSQSKAYNRYQHVLYTGTQGAGENAVLDNPAPDIVRVTVKLQSFDFRLSGAQLVLATDAQKTALAANASLSFMTSLNGWSAFTVN